MDFSDMYSVVSVSLFLLSLLITLYLNYRLRNKIIKKDETINSLPNLNNGWCFIKWDSLKNNKYVEKAIAELRNDFSEDYNSKFMFINFDNIHFRDIYSLLSLCKEIHESSDLDERKENNIKRLITVSSVLFNFKVPFKLWLFDAITIETILRYYIICEVVEFDITKFRDVKLDKPNDEDNANFLDVLKAIPNGFTYISKVGNNRAPNIIHLFNLINKNNNKLYVLLNKDINNLKRLMTMCYTLAGIGIPSDYLLVDENVFKYLNNPNCFKENKKYLSVVK